MVADPSREVDAWTHRVMEALPHDRGVDLRAIPARGRKSLESDSSYAARCLRERLRAVDTTQR